LTEIPDDDLRVETWPRTAYPGWRVRDLDAAVVITHIPTGLSVASSEQRSQILNKAAAMRALQKLLEERGKEGA
jgi:protein subunit release factor A